MNRLKLNRYLYKINKDIIKKLDAILLKTNIINVNFILTNKNKLYFYFIYNNNDYNTIFYNHYNCNIQLLKYMLNNDKYFNVNIVYLNDKNILDYYIVNLNDSFKCYDKSIKFKVNNYNEMYFKYHYLNEIFSTIFKLFSFKDAYYL